MTDQPLTVAVITGSTTPSHFGPVVTDWVVAHLRERADLRPDVVDLTQLPLPLRRTALAARVGAADAFLVVTPEYNHGYPAGLKAAIDSVYREWHAKPVGMISYGGISGGLRAVEQLRQVFAELHTVVLRDTVSFHRTHTQFDEAGAPLDPAGCGGALKVLLDHLTWWGAALRKARADRPYLS